MESETACLETTRCMSIFLSYGAHRCLALGKALDPQHPAQETAAGVSRKRTEDPVTEERMNDLQVVPYLPSQWTILVQHWSFNCTAQVKWNWKHRSLKLYYGQLSVILKCWGGFPFLFWCTHSAILPRLFPPSGIGACTISKTPRGQVLVFSE